MKLFLSFLLSTICFWCSAQDVALHNGFDGAATEFSNDTLVSKTILVSTSAAPAAIPVPVVADRSCIRPLLLPATLIAYGIVAHNNTGLRNFDWSTKDMIQRNARTFRCRVDDYLQYSPMLAVYGLNACGIKGKHKLGERTLLYGMSALVSGAVVTGMKRYNAVMRPDGSANNSFPSGHTTTAFAAAEFLHQEYKDKSVWYSIAGYTVAAATGMLRMYNNKHFLSDVVCGAGLGMLSTKLVYLVYPALKKSFRKKSAINPAII